MPLAPPLALKMGHQGVQNPSQAVAHHPIPRIRYKQPRTPPRAHLGPCGSFLDALKRKNCGSAKVGRPASKKGTPGDMADYAVLLESLGSSTFGSRFSSLDHPRP